jgi:peroxiredoxin
MKRIRWFAVFAIALLQPMAYGQDETQSSLVKVGDIAPDFTCQTLSGKAFSLSGETGKVVLVNFFATWCGACVQEMPHLEKELFQKYAKENAFTLIALGREHEAQELKKFAKENSLTFPIAPDSKREIYGKYAQQYIPRNVVIGKDGRIKLMSVGYTESGFQEIIQTIETELKVPSQAKPTNGK